VGTPEELKPAWYALRPGRGRDWVTVLHPPYTLWHLSYVAVGAALAPHFHTNRLVAALVAFFLALGISAHVLDEVRGRPLGTGITHGALVATGVISLAGAVAIGIAAAAAWGAGVLVFVAIGALLVPAYNLEWFGGRIHNDWGFALAWGAFPVLTGFFVEAQTIRVEAVIAAGYATAFSLMQRTLSTTARRARRVERTPDDAVAAERALRLGTAAAVCIAAALVAARLR
jgi:hypothetical protein